MAVYPPHPPFKISSGSYDMQIPSTNLYSRMEKGTAKVTECPVQEMLQREPGGYIHDRFQSSVKDAEPRILL